MDGSLKMEVAWFDAEKWEKEYLKDKASKLDIEFFEKSLTPETVEKAMDFDAVTVFVDSRVNREVMESLDADLVACRSTGYDHVAIEAAKENEIDVCNVPQYGSSTVAEHTFGLMLSLSRKIYDAIRKVEDGSFDHEGLRGTDLHGKKLGVIGTGSIGQNVIQVAKGFGMDVVAYDPYGKEELEDKLGFMYVSLEDLLTQSDVVTLHCPLTDSNRHMLSEEEFDRMEDILLINTARGGLIDTEALITALENDSVSAAGLDVLEEECYMDEDIEVMGDLGDECDLELILEDHILMERDDVLVTPHNAFNSVEAMHRIADATLDNLSNRENSI